VALCDSVHNPQPPTNTRSPTLNSEEPDFRSSRIAQLTSSMNLCGAI